MTNQNTLPRAGIQFGSNANVNVQPARVAEASGRDGGREAAKGASEMTCHTKEVLESMLEDVVNELDLSEEALAEHGPLGTPPAELVHLVLAQKDSTIRMLKAGMTTSFQVPGQPPSMPICLECLRELPKRVAAMVAEKCQTCDGCGEIADDEEGMPWTFWMNLPVKSAAAVIVGFVKPIPCPACKGTGKRRREQA